MKTLFKGTLGILLGIFLLGTIVTDQAAATKVRKNIHKSFPLVMGGKVSIENVNGNIELVGWEKDSVDMEIEITVQHSSHKRAEEFLEKIELLFDNSQDHVSVEVDYPGHGSNGMLSWLFGFGDPTVEVRFVVKAPQQSNLAIQTVNGEVAVEHIKGDIDCKTTNGGIDVGNVEGKVSSKTVNGGIAVELNKVGQFDEMNFRTVNGGIHLSLPGDVKANLEASTVNGGIDSEMPLEISGKISRSSLKGKINGGGGLLILKTVNGGITIQSSK